MSVRIALPRQGVISQRTWDDLPNLVSLLIFLGVTAAVFRSWEFGLIVTASLGFHELGHAGALWYYGLDSRISFGLAGAWTVSSMADRRRLSQLQNTIIHLAGPAFSLLLALIAMLLQAWWRPADQHLGVLANFSAQVGLLNLLPLGPLTDGGKIARRMMISLSGRRRTIAIGLPIIVTILMLGVYIGWELPLVPGLSPESCLLGLVLVGVWVTGSLFYEASRPPAMDSDGSRPMRPGQVYFMILIVWDLLMLGLLITAVTPFWLTPDYVLGTFSNVIAVLNVFL